jgi:hypothetical protein
VLPLRALLAKARDTADEIGRPEVAKQIMGLIVADVGS